MRRYVLYSSLGNQTQVVVSYTRPLEVRERPGYEQRYLDQGQKQDL